MGTPDPWISLPVSALANGPRRLDGESYLSPGYLIRRTIENLVSFRPLTDLATVVLPNRLKGIQVGPDQGIGFLTATQVFDIRPRARKWLAAGKIRSIEKLYASPGTILVTRSGTVGDTILTYKPLEGLILSDDLLRVTPHDAVDLPILHAFLRTRYGKEMMRSSRYGSVVKHLEPEHLMDFPVPEMPADLREEADRVVPHVYALREQAYDQSLEAERLFSKALGVTNERLPDDEIFTGRASAMFGRRRRLEAHFYNQRAQHAMNLLEQSGNRVESLRNATRQVFGVPRFKHVYADKGIPYLDSEDLFKIHPELTKFIPAKTKKDPQSYFVARGWLLMACSGQIYGLNGSVVLAGLWHEEKIISNHVLRIVPNETVRPGYLQTALSHPSLGRPCVLRYAFGSEVPEIAPEDILDFPLVRLDESTEWEIADLIESATDLRERANEAEAVLLDRIDGWLEARMDSLETTLSTTQAL